MWLMEVKRVIQIKYLKHLLKETSVLSFLVLKADNVFFLHVAKHMVNGRKRDHNVFLSVCVGCNFTKTERLCCERHNLCCLSLIYRTKC